MSYGPGAFQGGYPYNAGRPGLTTGSGAAPAWDIAPAYLLNELSHLYNIIQTQPGTPAAEAAAKRADEILSQLYQQQAFSQAANVSGAAPGLVAGAPCAKPDFINIVCGVMDRRDWRRPIVSQCKHSDTVVVGANVDAIAPILAQLFAADADRLFFEGDDPIYRPQTLGRMLAGLEISFSISGIVDVGGTQTYLDSETADLLEEKLLECLVSVFRDASQEPWIDTHPCAYYRDGGNQFPTSLAQGASWYDERARVRITNPPASVLSTGTTNIEFITAVATNFDVTLCVRGLFVVPGMALDFYQGDVRKR